jgi:hypothetical protein
VALVEERLPSVEKWSHNPDIAQASQSAIKQREEL